MWLCSFMSACRKVDGFILVKFCKIVWTDNFSSFHISFKMSEDIFCFSFFEYVTKLLFISSVSIADTEPCGEWLCIDRIWEFFFPIGTFHNNLLWQWHYDFLKIWNKSLSLWNSLCSFEFWWCNFSFYFCGSHF